MRAALYLRISDDRQGAGLGVARQEQDCRRLVEARGWSVQQVYTDNDVSAYSGKPRPAYERLLAAVAAAKVDIIVTWHADRLHRSPRELERYIDVCESAHVSTATVTAGDLDLSTPSGRMVARMLGAAARHESEHKSERQRRKALQLAEDGQVGNGGYRPYGYDADRKTIVDIEAERLRWAYRQVIAGRSLRSICHELTEQGHLTTTGRPWSVQGLRYNLLTGRNAGLREHRRVIVGPAVWPAVVDRLTWEQARAVLLSPGRRPTQHNGQPYTAGRKYLLTGFLVCGKCGGSLLPRRTSASQRYGCKATKDGGCGGILIRMEPLEELVVEALLTVADRWVAAQQPGDDTARFLAVIAQAERRVAELVDVFGVDGNALALRSATSAEERRITAARREMAVEVTRIPDPAGLRTRWPDLDLAQRRSALAAFVDHIMISPALPGNSVQPERVNIVWR